MTVSPLSASLAATVAMADPGDRVSALVTEYVAATRFIYINERNSINMRTNILLISFFKGATCSDKKFGSLVGCLVFYFISFLILIKSYHRY